MKRAERTQLGAVIDEVRAWVSAAQESRHLAAHMPLSRPLDLDGDAALLDVLDQAAASRDLDAAQLLARAVLFDGRKKLQPAHEAAARLATFHSQMRAAGSDEALAKLRARLISRASDEASHLRLVLTDLARTRTDAASALANVKHMPISRARVLTAPEETAIQSLLQIFDLHEPGASQLLDPSTCTSGDCQERHSSALLLRELHQEASEAGTSERVRLAEARVKAQLKTEQAQVQTLFRQALRWEDRVKQIRKSRDVAKQGIESRVSKALEASATVKLDEFSVKLAPLTADDAPLIPHLTLLRDAPLSLADEKTMTRAIEAAATFVPLAKQAFNAQWECSRDGKCVAVHDLTPAIYKNAQTFEDELQRLVAPPATSTKDLDRLLDPTLGFRSHLPRSAREPELVQASVTERAKAGVGAIANAVKATKDAAAVAKAAAETVRAGDVASALKAMDLETLKKASLDKIRVTALANAGLNTVWDVLKYDEKYYLQELAGLGETSARSIAQAALRLFEGVRDETPVRIDVKRKGKRTEALLDALRAWDAVRRFTPTKEEVALAKGMIGLFKARTAPTHVLALLDGQAPSARPRITPLLEEALKRSTQTTASADVWTDFLSRPSDYFGMLTELGFITEDEKKMHGDLPEEIVDAVRAKELKRDYLTASLRTYQSFGARFALVQEKVVIGDEMGLGKTVEALAVMTHLAATGQSHFLVVCPAAVVSNWVRETAKHTKLRASRLHGPLWERNYAAKSWVRNGGVAVTTYDLLAWAQDHIASVEVGSAVFDEAHYIKNPLAKRSQAAAEVIDSLKYAILMTGTPLENSVQEFRNLVGYIRPDLSESAPEYLPSKFRKHVAPAYLRRNQEDVLTELPELVEIDEWMGMSTADERAYRTAVQDGNFMLMRRAAMLSERSQKVERLIEIVAEAEANGRRVIVFSYFREVLSEIARLLPGEVFGPLTGSVPAKDRQSLIDRFSAAGHGAVLVAQVTAGGVGLNIQSASVVVICEPQLKPTTESQAIARAHRMGQTNTVQVHRLLSENSVDERIREILADKRQLFDDFARDSVIAKQAPDAVDVSDAELARVVIAAERERLFGQADTTRE